ncbi:LIP-domain-containing protein [Aspergillus steynii IBT 23096]|uniref:LIP-domain-containing protein n=1 Tax=Aspergillus steynii IBT 23096 TaxID=1392250 RepID=A0A2I2FT38_9EURO|nr:LIP-domain-containing protein [Aspergillus steynii IBT 23096]PLB43805.1 LIP-domain-containing protein [Aspergillus steynii IBT 23096]
MLQNHETRHLYKEPWSKGRCIVFLPSNPVYPLTMKLIWCSLLGLYLGRSHASPTPPSEDSFYRLPADYETKPPGHILDHRPLPHPLKDPLPSFFETGHQIIYRTTDSFDQPTASLATLLIPPNANLSRILAYFPVQNSASIDCSPSYVIADGVNEEKTSDRVIELVHTIVLAGALNQGWPVIMPDYEGFGAAFMANRRGAFAGLDSIRAALASSPFTHISADAVAVMMGYSGASPSTVLAAEFQRSYAPELKIEGVATGGILMNLTTVLELAIPAPNNLPPALWGLANEYPPINRVVQAHLAAAGGGAEKTAEFEAARDQCAGALKENFGTANMSTYFDSLDFLNTSAVTRILDENSPGQGVPGAPVLVYESTHDDKSPIGDADALVRNYCAAGVLVDYRKYKVESHTALSVDGMFAALVWAKERFDGVSMGEECRTSDHFSALGADAAAFVPDALTGWVDRHLGTNLGAAL